MKNKLIKIAIVGKTNSGKSTFLNRIIGEKISITNRKINTTIDMIEGIINKKNTQMIFYDTPGYNENNNKFSNQKIINTSVWETLYDVDYILYFVNSYRYNFKSITNDLNKIIESKKFISVVFNKIDLIKIEKLLPLTKKFIDLKYIKNFFYISAKYNNGIKELSDYLEKKASLQNWIYFNEEITNKDDIYISNECTRNAILKFLHKEIPYNVNIKNTVFKYLNNKDIKIKQTIKINNKRYKPILLGKKGITIKRIRENSQNEISKIMKSKVHLYLKID